MVPATYRTHATISFRQQPDEGLFILRSEPIDIYSRSGVRSAGLTHVTTLGAVSEWTPWRVARKQPALKPNGEPCYENRQ
jgi:hypothetical protein